MSLGSGRCLFVFLVGLWAGIIGGGIILAILIPNLGDAAFVVTVPFSLAVVVMLLAAFWYGLKMGFFRGTQGPNQYGPDPIP